MSELGRDILIHTADMRVDYGDTTAVHGLNLDIAAGEVYGLIGPNGAGKTSTIKVLATLLEPTYGEVFIGGHDTATHAAEARAVLGYMPDLAPVWEDLKVWEFLDVFARAYAVSHADRRRRVDEVLDVVSLESKRHAMSGSLSRGMTQRLVLAKTLLHKPRVLLLDEPASGLDPIARIEMRDLLKRLAAEGRTVLVSSHILTELSDFCSSIGIMEKGRMVVNGPIDELVAARQTHRRFVVELLEPAIQYEGPLAELDGVAAVASSGDNLDLDFAGDDREASQLLAGLVAKGLPVKGFYEKKRGVEDIMLEVGAKEVS
ncbi:ABC transporter ATP-binding protein [Algisphaera agarilytica]|uniref:ABC-2 type transport system ATP-binding protein n=1 Tax=Algisphaera agarilytica TaxID=1385975 RepID=A0A7X0H8X0_9BACT|nr:ABC transporter ATP-binding protein [Algisphaera agarilytica]MBB6431308.1 ABC-2 type transport system ATP-binding protein [Algisphaera agarilytica]